MDPVRVVRLLDLFDRRLGDLSSEVNGPCLSLPT
jgi:hypothetical protein